MEATLHVCFFLSTAYVGSLSGRVAWQKRSEMDEESIRQRARICERRQANIVRRGSKQNQEDEHVGACNKNVLF